MTDVGHDARRGLAGRELLVMMRPSRPLTGWYRLSTGIAHLFIEACAARDVGKQDGKTWIGWIHLRWDRQG